MRKALLLLFLGITIQTLAQETISIKVPNHGYPKVTTYTDEQIKKFESVTTPTIPSIQSFGNLPAGTSPTPSPESAVVNRFKDIAVNSFTGTAIVPLPLYTLQEGALSVPISLNYNASGMKTHEVASWSGMNWALSAGGMISRQVRGIPDEGKFDINTWSSSHLRKGYYLDGFKSTSTVNDDTEPDVFYLNINGQSYKFMYKYSGEPRFIFFPDADIQVKPTFELITGRVGRFVKFEVVMPDGTIYIFGDGASEKSAEVDVKFAQDESIHPGASKWNHYWKNEGVTSAWYLKKIISPYGQEINFEYDKVRYSFFKIAEDQATGICPTPAQVEKKINKVYVEGTALNRILSTHKRVEFNKRGRVCEEIDGEEYCYYNTIIAPVRQDIDEWTSTPSNQSSAKKLVEMSVMDNVTEPTDTLNYKFDYGHFTAFEDDLPSGYSTADVGLTHTKRLRLERVTMPDKSFYRFRYNGDGPTYNGKSRLNYGIDHFGFSNGATGNRFLTGLIPRDSFFSTCTPNTSNRETDPNFLFEGSLDSIIVSTGSQTKFIYEPHQARNYKSGSSYKPIGGARIKEVHSKDLISGIETVKNYSYLMADGVRPSGFMCMKPIYRFRNNYNQSGSNSSIYDRLMGEIGRTTVGYSRVIEQIKDAVGTPLGKTIYTFDQDTTELSIQRIESITCTGEYPDKICDTLFNYEPERVHPQGQRGIFKHNFKDGNPLKTEVFNQNGDTLTVNSYEYSNTGIETDATYATKLFRVNNYNLGYTTFESGYFLQSYYLSFRKYRIESQTSKVYSQAGTNPITTTQNFTYKDEIPYPAEGAKGKHNFLVKTQTTDGQGHTIESLSKYAADFSFGLDTIYIERTCLDEFGDYYPCDTTEYIVHVPRIGSQIRGIYEMQTKHILATEVETWTKNNGRIIGANYNRFGRVNVVGGTPIETGFDYFLKESFVSNGIASDGFYDANYNRANNDTLYRDSRYYSVIDYQNYNPLGLPKQVKPFGGAVSGIDYDVSNLLPLQSIQNIGGNVIDTTSYEYEKKIFGLSKQISPNKLAINYAYYANSEQNKVGQLKQITDKDGNVLAHYEYPYLNQSLQGTAGTFITDASKNRMVSRSPRIATTNPYQDYTKVSTSVTYADGSGRSLQSVGYKLSPTAKDLLSSTPEYDSYGRPKKNILPVASSVATGQYQSNSQSLAQTFYGDTAPYSEVTQYEVSPLSRTFKGIGAGAAFRPNKESEQKFETGNFGIAKYELDINGSLQISSYTGNEIFKTTGIDEQGQKSIDFSDKDGRTLENRVQFTGDGTQTSHYLITTYVYDYLGRMAMVIPPKLYGKIPNNTVIASSPYLVGLYLSKYDERNRVVEKHTPNAGWSYMIYNRLGQMVMSQNSRIRANNQWEFVKYDAFGRTATTGVLVNNSSRATLQTAFDNYTQDKQYEEQDNSGIEGYTNRSFPFLVNAAEIMTVNYYDDYSWKTTTDLSFVAYKGTRYPNAKGLLTGNKVRRLDTQSWLRSAMYYDDKNRLIQSQSENRFGQINQTDMVFDFIGQLLEERTIYRKPSTTDIESRTAYSYDHAGRKTQAIHFYTGHAPELLATYEYDELGRMIRKNLNEAQKDSIIRQSESLNKGVTDVAKKYILLKPGTLIEPDSVYLAFIGSGLQNVSYAYNIKGNLRGINLTSNGRLDSSKVFSLKLDHYEDGRFYNGLLSKQSWKSHSDTTTRHLLYDYDKANRYTNAQFKGKTNEKYNENLSYDSNGNIKKLNRFGLESANNWQRIDSLSYHYGSWSNQLNGVLDFATLKGHKDNGDSTDYTYYLDGSLKSDANKGITNIVYNYLGLQDEIQFGENQKIKNIYTADGIKLAQLLINGSTTIRTDYIGGLLYRNDTLISISHDEGIIKRKSDNSYKYQYFITDHLGNNRVIFEKLNDTVYVAQRADYYAFGGLMEGLSSSLDSISWNFLFQGKEYVDAFGYNSYDFLTRQYDQNLGRMWQVDGANQFASGYVGMGNMPTVGIDPDGQFWQYVAAAAIGGTLNVVSNWSKIKGTGLKGFAHGAAYFTSGAVGGMVSIHNVAAGGAITSGGNAFIDIATGNVPTIKNFGDAAKYVGVEAIKGVVTSYIGGQVGKYVGPKISSLFGWMQQGFSNTIAGSTVINGELIEWAGEAGVKATYGKLGGAVGSSVAKQATNLVDDATKVGLTSGEIRRIENAATRINKDINLVGSRAKGTATAISDWDYAIDGLTNKEWKKIKNALPGSPSRIDNMPRMIDIFKDLDKTKPFIKFSPKR
jgi:hypothetical protein